MSALTLIDRMREDMQLLGLAARSLKSYLDAVKSLAKFCGRPPTELETLTEEELRAFFLHLVTERRAARGTVTIYRGGIRFLVETTSSARGRFSTWSVRPSGTPFRWY